VKIQLTFVDEEKRIGFAIIPRKVQFLEPRRTIDVARSLRPAAAGGRRLRLLLQAGYVCLHVLHHLTMSARVGSAMLLEADERVGDGAVDGGVVAGV
jgi:hypothetical protein